MDACMEQIEKEGRQIGVSEERLGSYVVDSLRLVVAFAVMMSQSERDEISGVLAYLSREKDALAARYEATRHESLVEKIGGPEFKEAVAALDQIVKDLH